MKNYPGYKSLIVAIAVMLGICVFFLVTHFTNCERAVRLSLYVAPDGVVIRGNTNRIMSNNKQYFSFLAALSPLMVKLALKITAFVQTRKIIVSWVKALLHAVFHIFYAFAQLVFIVIGFCGFIESAPLFGSGWYSQDPVFCVFIAMLFTFNVMVFGLLNMAWYRQTYHKSW